MADLHLGNLTAGLTLDTAGLSKGISGAARQLQGLGGMLGSALSLGAIVAGLDTAIDKASDLGETANLIGVTFGNLAPEVVKTTARISKEVGRSRKDMLGYVASLGALIKPLTGSESAASEMSTTFAQLAVDMASFFNTTDPAALTALRSGLTGEMEPLKRFGIAMSVANLDAFALASGLGKTTKQMSEAEKVSLRYNFILSKTTDAQGDAARTSDGLANKSKRFAGVLEDTITQIGAVFLPIKSAILDVGIAAVDFFQGLPAGTKAVLVLGTAVGSLGVALALAAVAFAPLLAGFFSALVPIAGIALGIVGLVALFGALRMAWQANVGGIQEIMAKVGAFLVKAWEFILDVADFVATGIRDAFIDSIANIGMAYQKFREAVASAFQAIVGIAIRATTSMVDTMLRIVETKVGGIITAMKAVGIVPDSLIEGMSRFRGQVATTRAALKKVAAVGKVLNEKIFGKEAKEAAAAIERIKKAVRDMKKDTVGEDLKSGIQKALEFLKKEGPGIAKNMGDAIKDALGSAFDALPQSVKDFIAKLKSGFDSALDLGSGVSSPLKRGRSGGPSQELTPPPLVRAPITEAPKSILDALADAGQTILEGSGKLSSVVNAAVQGFETGGPIGALIALGTQLLMMSGSAGALFSALDAIITTVADTLGTILDGLKPILGAASIIVDAVLKPLAPVLKEIGAIAGQLAPLLVLFASFLRVFMLQFTLIAPILKAITPILDVVFKGFFSAMKFFGLGVLGIAVLIAEVIGWVVGGIGKLFAGVLNFVAGILEFVAKILPGKNKAIQDTAAALRGAADSAKEWGMGAQALKDEFQKMKDLTFDGAAADAAGAFEDLGEAANAASAALTNIPSGFKVAKARFDAISTGETGGAAPYSEAPTGRGDTVINLRIDQVALDRVKNVDDFFLELLDVSERVTSIRSGAIVLPGGGAG